MKKDKPKRAGLSYAAKNELAGVGFVTPFLIGFLFFFLVPIIQSIQFAFSRITTTGTGIKTTFIGFQNFNTAIFSEPTYIRTILESIKQMVLEVPIIILFSLFIAMILNQNFKGRMIARSIFFLPVIIVSGVIINIISNDYFSGALMSGEVKIEGAFKGVDSYAILLSMGFGQKLIDTVVPIVYNIFNLAWSSGVQILLFLAGLQTVPSSMYECAKIEGATQWESFWKITFPLISPMLLMNIVYSMVDNFTSSKNQVIQMINEQVGKMKIDYAASLSWLYLLIVIVIIFIAYMFINKRITYTVE